MPPSFWPTPPLPVSSSTSYQSSAEASSCFPLTQNPEISSAQRISCSALSRYALLSGFPGRGRTRVMLIGRKPIDALSGPSGASPYRSSKRLPLCPVLLHLCHAPPSSFLPFSHPRTHSALPSHFPDIRFRTAVNTTRALLSSLESVGPCDFASPFLHDVLPPFFLLLSVPPPPTALPLAAWISSRRRRRLLVPRRIGLPLYSDLRTMTTISSIQRDRLTS